MPITLPGEGYNVKSGPDANFQGEADNNFNELLERTRQTQNRAGPPRNPAEDPPRNQVNHENPREFTDSEADDDSDSENENEGTGAEEDAPSTGTGSGGNEEISAYERFQRFRQSRYETLPDSDDELQRGGEEVTAEEPLPTETPTAGAEGGSFWNRLGASFRNNPSVRETAQNFRQTVDSFTSRAEDIGQSFEGTGDRVRSTVRSVRSGLSRRWNGLRNFSDTLQQNSDDARQLSLNSNTVEEEVQQAIRPGEFFSDLAEEQTGLNPRRIIANEREARADANGNTEAEAQAEEDLEQVSQDEMAGTSGTEELETSGAGTAEEILLDVEELAEI